MARVYDENGKIVGTTEAIDVRLNQANELYNSANLDEALKELAKVFTIEEQLKIIKTLLGYNEKEGGQQTLDRTLLIQDLYIWEETLFALKNNDGTFNITMDDITVLGDATVTFDETAKTLKVVSTSTSGYQGIRINKSIPYNNEKEAFLCVVTCKNNLDNGVVSLGETSTHKNFFMDIDSNGFSRYEYICHYGISQIPISIYGEAIDVEVENIKYIRIGRLADCHDIHDLDKKIANMNLDGLAPLNSPDFTGDISLGRKADTTIGANSVAEGNNVTASGTYSHAEGSNTTANGQGSHAEGSWTIASGYGSHAECSWTTASGSYSHAEGGDTKASGNYSHAEGRNTTALGKDSHAEGYSTNTASSKVSSLSTSTANDTIITAWNSNKFSLAKGESSHVEGKDNLALGKYSHAEGSRCIAYNEGHAEGCECIAGNENITSFGYGYHAEGYKCVASGTCSHAEGLKTIASGENQHVQGRLNIEDTENKYAHIVGNGHPASATRSNAHTLDWNGNAWYAGKVTAGKDPTEDNDLVTKRYVDGCKLNSTAVVGFNYSKNFGKCLYTYDTPTSDIILALLGEVEETEPTNKTELHFFINYTTAINITLPTNCKWQSQPTFEVGHVYELIFMYIPTIGWLGKYIDYQ